MRNLVLFYQKLTFPFVFDAAEKEGVNIFLVVHPQDPIPSLQEVQRMYPCVADIFSVDIFDDETMSLARLKDYIEESHVEAILCLRDEALPFVSKAANKVGLPYFDDEAVFFKARDKSLMREAFATAGCNTPKFIRLQLGGLDDNGHYGLRYPVVIKPVSGFGSMGVTRANSDEELDSAIEKVKAINSGRLAGVSRFNGDSYEGVIVEEFIDGPEFVAETFSDGGEHSVLVIGEKGDPKGPYFEEGYYLAPARISEEVERLISEEVKKSLSAIGLKNGPAHVELRMSRSEGVPYIVEVGARIGGSGVSQFMVEAVYGLSMFSLCLSKLAGENPKPKIQRALSRKDNCIAINYIIPVGSGGYIREIQGLDFIKEHKDTENVIRFMADNQKVSPYPDFVGYPGFILSAHKSYRDAEDFLELVENSVKVIYD